MEKKYKLTEETTNVYGRILHRIEALKDFGNVKKGDKGGFVENEKNLSQYRNCWVYDDAKVYGNAKVIDNATVESSAKIFDNAIISGNAKVCGNAKVYDNAKVYGRAKVYGNAKVCGNSAVCDYVEVYGDAKISYMNGDRKIKKEIGFRVDEETLDLKNMNLIIRMFD